MKKLLFPMLLMLLAAGGQDLFGQAKGEKFVGLNAAALPYRVFEPEVEYFLLNSVGLALNAGFCFDRKTTTARYVEERILGGFFDLGPRFHFFSGEKWSSYAGIAYHFGRFRRDIAVVVPHYYGEFEAAEREVQMKMGYALSLGTQYRKGGFVLQMGVKYTVIGSRGFPYGENYWVPGVGRIGQGRSARTRPRNFGFLPQVKLMYVF